MTILYLEDDPSLRNFMKERLQQNGYSVIACGGTDEADEYLEERDIQIDCIITDLHMNGEFLDPKYENDTDGYLMTGWVWLEHCVWNRVELENVNVIIYSGFIEYLDSYLKKRRKYDQIRTRHLRTVKKRGGGTDEEGIRGLTSVLSAIESLEEHI